MIKLNLGCGKYPLDNFDKNIDRIDFGYNDVCDFEIQKLPYKNNSIDYIWSNHVLEHMKDVQNILNECWRVLKPNGELDVKVPYGLWDGASKPVHYQCITACWFDWLRRDDIYKWYGYRSWEIKQLIEVKGKDGKIYEIKCKLKPKK